MTNLLLVQYSDPHIGSRIQGGGFIWKTTGHDLNVLEAFSDALGKIRRMRADRRVLVHSGDASARGASEQLDLYLKLRETGEQVHGNGKPILKLPRFRAGFGQFVDIPGNHDFWNGKILNPILNRQARSSYWPPSSSWSQRVPLAAFELVIHGVCSTSGASARQQVCAVGDFDTPDLHDLERRIKAMTGGTRLRQVHVIVTHHSPSVGNGRMHGLAPGGIQLLEDLCVRHGVAVLLTGHDHSYDIVNFANRPVEVRSSTAVQLNRWPQTQIRQFWLHHICDDGTQMTWTAVPWLYETRKFVPTGSDRAVVVKR